MNDENTLHLIGWLLFIVCAIFYVIASLEARSTSAIIGSLLFLAGCCVFIIPVLRRMRNKE